MGTSDKHAAGASSTIGAAVSADVAGDEVIPVLCETDDDDDHVALEHTSLADQIRERAEDVCEDREWDSLFDLVVFAFLRKRRVHACFGAQVVDLVQVFAPWLVPVMDNSKTPIRLLGCVAIGAHLLVAKTMHGCLPKMNHWVIGVPIEGHCIDVDATPEGVVGDSTTYVDARLAAGKVGWCVLETDDYGNCCMDALTHHDRKPRNQENWMATRQEIAFCMDSIADQDLWHDCWKACQEARVPAPKPKLVEPEELAKPEDETTGEKPPPKLGTTVKKWMAAGVFGSVKNMPRRLRSSSSQGTQLLRA
jgi:hypothetical protein